jgi:hypothetical protein
LGIFAAGSQDSVILGDHMKPVHTPRSLIITILVLVTATFLVGTLRAFDTAQASASPTPTSTASVPAENDTDLTPTPVPTPVRASADTTGIIALAIVIVIVLLVGAILGGTRTQKRKSP